VKPQKRAGPTVLTLNLHRKYFDQIVLGEKTYEFRDRTDYWKTRLEGREYDVIRFRNGYLSNAPEMIVEFLSCEKRRNCYAIKLGKILKLMR
jgi:hypothetical protein